MKEDETIANQAEPICKHALPLMVEGYEDTWCSKTCQICYKILGEECEYEELSLVPSV